MQFTNCYVQEYPLIILCNMPFQQHYLASKSILKDAPILLMDEPTEMLDPAQEEVLQNAIEELCVKRTVIVIAHRLKTLARADRILFMEKARS